jgi:hypothetical protein
MKEWQQRVCDEKDELQKRILRLEDFMYTATFHSLGVEEKADLREQQEAMIEYRDTLSRRIRRFR